MASFIITEMGSDMAIRIVSSLITGYLLGSVVVAILISRFIFKEDVRTKGSGNSGATNAARVYGLPFGLLTFAGDVIKAILACRAGWFIGGANTLAGSPLGGCWCMAAAGVACMVGHCFPVFFRFKGGKGVSVGAALALMIDWRLFVIGIGVFLLMAIITKRVSIGSILGAIALGISAYFLKDELPLKLMGIFAAVMVVVMHYSNISRIINGTEKPFTLGKH